MAVSENERKIENLRKDHEEWGSKLHDLQMMDKDDEKRGNQKMKGHSHFSPEIEALDKQITDLSKKKEKSDELIKKVNLVEDQVKGWVSKVIQKIDQQFGENLLAHEHRSSLDSLF